MKTRGLLLIVCAAWMFEASFGAVGTWKNFTSMKDVRGVARKGTSYWAATGGGLFGWNAQQNSYQLLTSADGLRSIDLTTIGIDSRGELWSGTSTGLIHIYSQQNHKWQYIFDIANKRDEPDKRINNIVILGDTAFICTNFGVSLIRVDSYEFRDTYRQFGSLNGNTKVSVSSAVIFNDSLWLTVSDRQSTHRIAVASLTNSNLQFSQSWTLRTVGNTAAVPRQLAVFNNKLYTGTSIGLYVYGSGDWNAIPALAGPDIIGLSTSLVSLSVATTTQAFSVDVQENVQQVGGSTPFLSTSITSDEGGQPVVGCAGGGLLTFNSSDSSWTSHLPDGPNSNQFINVAVDTDGRVWGASGYNGNGKGFYRYDGRSWKSFTLENSGLSTNDYYRVSVGCDGSVWASSWGWGVIEIPSGYDRIDSLHIYGTNKGMVGLANNPNFIVNTTVLCDGAGNHWMGITKAGNGKILAVRDQHDIWTTLQANVGSIPISTLLDNVPVDRSFAVDAYNNLWGVARSGNLRGVFSFGNRGSIEGSVDFFLTASDGSPPSLPSNEVTTIVADRENTLWVGTDHGIAIILDPLNPKRSGGIASYVPLRGTVINCIAVDALNQKWIGTPEGVLVYSPDGTQQIASYDVPSTDGKLIDNDVKSIAIDGNTGTVYFGTLSGLASVTTDAVNPKLSFDKLIITPNPFLVPNSSPVVIDGLVENSTLKILSIDGRLVRQLKSPGGRIGRWDGKDEEGRFVSSGVYIVVASSEKDAATAKGKIAVIRR